jgi:predicted dehydrogenase
MCCALEHPARIAAHLNTIQLAAGAERGYGLRESMIAENPPRVGLIGCGSWGRFILRDLLQLGCEVAVVARGEETVGRAEEGGAHRVVREIEELPGVEGLVVATPTISHAKVVTGLLDLSVPIFVEKPLTDDSAEADRLAAAAGDRIFVMDKWRHHPGVELLASIARSAELGEVISVRTHRLGWGNPHHDVDGVWILAPHDLSIALEILGHLPRARSAVVELIGETVAGMTAILGDRPAVVMEVSTSSPFRQRRVAVHCTGGVAVLPDGYSDRVEIYPQSDPRDPTVPDPIRREISTEFPLLRELRAFVEHLRGGPPPRSSAQEGADIVRRIAELRRLAGVEDS